MRKRKFSLEEQISHMKEKGITFNIINEEDAGKFLSNNTYYFKIKSYSKNYEKYTLGENKGKYINLEFAYLQELSTIDMHLRHLIMNMSLDIEHSVKARMLCDFNCSSDDGYAVVDLLLADYPDIQDRMNKKGNNSFCMDLVNKLKKDFAIWNVVEVLSFYDFLILYKLFYDQNPEALTGKNLYYPLNSVRKLRNAAAHNNCLINSLRRPYSNNNNYQDRKVHTFISKVPGIDAKSRRNNLDNPVIHDFITMLYVFDLVITSSGIRKYYLNELDHLFNVRMIRNKEYFQKNNDIVKSYKFIKKVVDYLINTCI